MLRKLASAAFSNAYLLLTLGALFWAANIVVGRAVHGHVPPVALGSLRWWIAILILLPFALPHLRRDWPLVRGSLPLLTFLGVMGVSCFSVCLFVGLNHTTAINAAVVQSSGPMSIALACLLIFGDRLGLAQVAGIALSLAGVLYTVLRGDLTSLMALEFNAGDLWILAAVVGWAIYTAFLRKRPAIHWLSYAFAIFLVGAVTTAPLVVAEHMSGWRLQADRTTFLAMAYVAIFPSLLSYVFFNRGVELIGGARTSAFLNLVPPMTAALAILFLGEELGLYHVIGFALILAGVTLVARGPRQ